jgi:hypothetical protein
MLCTTVHLTGARRPRVPRSRIRREFVRDKIWFSLRDKLVSHLV